MLRKLRRAMGDRDRACWLTGLVEADDALVGGRRPRQARARRRGQAAGAVRGGAPGERAGLLAAKVVGAFHGVSRTRLQECLDEFVFRFNRRFREGQLPARLVEAAVTHVPVPLRLKPV